MKRANRPTPIVLAELAVMIFAALLRATAGAFLGALGDRSTTDDPLDDPPPPKPTGAR